MRPSDFLKATACCGLIAYLAYRFPALSQGLIIALLSLIWLTYVHSTFTRSRQN